jgi:hypothetical protein
MKRGSTPAAVTATTRALGVRPWRVAACSEAISIAAEPSLIPEHDGIAAGAQLFAFGSRVAGHWNAVSAWAIARGFKSRVRYIALPTMDDAVFCYWRRAA